MAAKREDKVSLEHSPDGTMRQASLEAGYPKRINPSLTDADRIDEAAHASELCAAWPSARVIPKVTRRLKIAGVQVNQHLLPLPKTEVFRRAPSGASGWPRITPSGRGKAALPPLDQGRSLHDVPMCGIVGILGWGPRRSDLPGTKLPKQMYK